jgi:outer membrane protein TolC
MIRCFTVILITSLLSGCINVGPDYKAPIVNVPKKWTGTPKIEQKKSLQPEQWWKSFNDPCSTNLLLMPSQQIWI